MCPCSYFLCICICIFVWAALISRTLLTLPLAPMSTRSRWEKSWQHLYNLLATHKHSIKTQVFQHIHNQSKHTELSTKHWRSRASISVSISKSERIRSQVYAQTSQLEVLRSTKSKPSGGICVQVGSQISRASCQEIKSRKRGKKASKLRLGKSYLSGGKS